MSLPILSAFPIPFKEFFIWQIIILPFVLKATRTSVNAVILSQIRPVIPRLRSSAATPADPSTRVVARTIDSEMGRCPIVSRDPQVLEGL
ncbi:hypothetical protein PUN28_016669 [Cardiocondyla obscurior]|uniref:Uncharacterized protein n=1 Tax=Cardiocondyla obscurior TaxID=286306 RepID=A0AAW2ES08_9HYME